MPDLRKLACLTVLCAACGACVYMPAPRLPPGARPPYPASAPQESSNTVPADFPNPGRDRRVCKQVDTDQGSKRVCMWQRQN